MEGNRQNVGTLLIPDHVWSVESVTGMLPGGVGTIDPASVQILNAPTWSSDPYGAIAVTATSLGVEIDAQTCPGGCEQHCRLY